MRRLLTPHRLLKQAPAGGDRRRSRRLAPEDHAMAPPKTIPMASAPSSATDNRKLRENGSGHRLIGTSARLETANSTTIEAIERKATAATSLRTDFIGYRRP